MSGARMIPRFISPDAPPGERSLFCDLRDDPSAKGWIVLHSLDLAKHVKQVQGEADFVILIPNEGAVVIEVKSHEYVKFDHDGWWLGTSSLPESRGPFKQASMALHSIIKYLDDAPGTFRSVPFTSLVAFTAVPFNTKSPEWHPWQVIDRQKLGANTIVACIKSSLSAAKRHYQSLNLSWSRSSPSAALLEKLAERLRPRFEIMVNPHFSRRTLEEDLIRCTEQQFRVLDSLSENDRMIVKGPAGTGKTCLAVESLRREGLVKETSSLALFCFNRHLAESLESRCSRVIPGVKLTNFHKWMLGVSGLRPSTTQKASSAFWTSELPSEVSNVLMLSGQSAGFLDTLVLDEAQDLFLKSYLDVFDLLLKGGLRGGKWKFFGDFERQDIFAQQSVSVEDFKRQYGGNGFATLKLDINCRNTKEISQYVVQMGKLVPPYSATLRLDRQKDPEILFYHDDPSQTLHLKNCITTLLADGFSRDDIVILSPKSDQSISSKLTAIQPWKASLTEYSGGKSGTCFSTIHSFKGLEAAAIILTDVDSLSSDLRSDLFYIGASRALHRLYVLAHSSIQSEIRALLS